MTVNELIKRLKAYPRGDDQVLFKAGMSCAQLNPELDPMLFDSTDGMACVVEPIPPPGAVERGCPLIIRPDRFEDVAESLAKSLSHAGLLRNEHDSHINYSATTWTILCHLKMMLRVNNAELPVYGHRGSRIYRFRTDQPDGVSGEDG